MILKALVCTASIGVRCETGTSPEEREKSSTKLHMKPLEVDLSSGVPRKDFV